MLVRPLIRSRLQWGRVAMPSETASVDLRHAREQQIIVPSTRRLRIASIPRILPVVRVIAARDLKVKYKQSILGPLWLIFQPMALLVAFLVAFRGIGHVETPNVPYAVYALAGLSVWAYFMAAITIGTDSVVSSEVLVRYTSCPRLAFPLAALAASLPSFGVVAPVAIGAAAVSGTLSVRILLLPLALGWLFLLTAGIVGVTASACVKYRDVRVAVPFLLQLGTFLTPVGFSLASLTPGLRHVVEANPMTGLIETTRWTMLSSYRPAVGAILLSLGATAVIVTVGWHVFARAETTMADDI
jgi:lipopolysaccharide transport system permease protein